MTLEMKLPFPPSVNNYWHQRVVHPKNGKRALAMTYISEKGREFRQQVVDAVWAYSPGKVKTIHGRVSISIVLQVPDRRTRDIDNFIKPLFDALTVAKVWADDQQVDRMVVRRGDIVNGGLTIVEIREIKKPLVRSLFS